MKKPIPVKRVLEMIDDPEFQLLAAEYPDLYADEIEAMNDYVRAITPELPEHVARVVPTTLRVVGTKVKRIEDPPRLTGQAIYASDVHLPEMLHAAILRSPHAHALIESIDTSEAEKLPGVRAILTHKNVPDVKLTNEPVRLAVNQEAHFAGEEMAAVAAEDIHTAIEAVKLIKVGWKVLPSLTDIEAAMAKGAPELLAPGKANFTTGNPVRRGDFDKAYATAAVKHEGRYVTATLQHGPLEPHVTVARWEGPERLNLWSSSQYMSSVRSSLASYFGLPRSHVRVQVENVGGGFGSKGGAQRDVYIAAVLARMTGRPVRVAYDRPGEFEGSLHRYAEVMQLKAGVDRDGKLVAYRADTLGDGAAYKGGTSALPPIQRLYAVKDAWFQETNVISNRPMTGPQRCVGDPQGTWAQEIFMDELAEKAGMDPLAFRLKNLATMDQDNNRPWNSIGIVECAQKGAAAIGWQQKWHKPGAKISGSTAHGIGMALHACGHGSMSLPMTAFVRLDRDGSLDVSNTLTEIGAGESTAMMIIAAETVGVRLESAFVGWNDTSFLPDAGVTAGSRGTISVGSAVRNAALDLKAQILQVASGMLSADRKPLLGGAKPEDLDTADGSVFVKADPSKRLPLADVATSTGSPMLGRGTHSVPPGTSMSTFAGGFAEVEVNTDTGEVTLLRYVATDDVGKAVNVLGVEQQIEGGASMGIGMGLSEEMKFDKPNNFPVHWNWENYAMPTTLDHPKFADFVPIIVEPIDKIGPYGAKGIGEPPTSPPPPAIANAIYNAIGVRIHDAPVTRDKILAGLAQKKSG